MGSVYPGMTTPRRACRMLNGAIRGSASVMSARSLIPTAPDWSQPTETVADWPLSTRVLLLCGAIAGPLFILIVLIQDYTRPDFDPRVFPLSQLSLGDWGWVQMTNFVLAGVLNLLYSVGLWRRLHPGPAGTWAPILTGVYGLGLVAVGVFTTDPVNGFPPGSVASPEPSWHGAVHALGGLVIFVVLAIALLVFARLFVVSRQRWWAVYCVATGVAMLVLFFGGFPNAALTARFLRVAVVLGWGASSIIAIKLLRDPRLTRRT
jgi:hypothetical membrane protein